MAYVFAFKFENRVVHLKIKNNTCLHWQIRGRGTGSHALCQFPINKFLSNYHNI